MSTGDNSAYIRSKLAERGVSAPVQFMKDGFDKWAESNAPARAGQVEKIAAEPSGGFHGGAMTVSQAKHMFKKIGSEAKHLMKKLHLVGGNRTIWGFELSDTIDQAADWAVKLSEGYLQIKDVLDKFLSDLDRQIIKNTDYSGPDADSDDKALLEFAKTLKTYFDKWKALLSTIEAIAKFIKDNLGQPAPSGSGLRGGASYTETWNNFVTYVEKKFNDLKDLMMWFFEHRVEVYGLLRTLDSLQPLGKTIADVLEPIFGKPTKKILSSTPTGSGKKLTLQFFVKMNKKHSGSKHKMSGGKKCSCHHGGVNPFPSSISTQHDASLGMGKHGGKNSKGSTSLMELLGKPSEVVVESVGGKRRVGGASYGGIRPPRPMPGSDYAPDYSGSAYGGKKPSARGAIVKKVMHEKGLSLPQASKYVKEHGLY